MFPAVPTEGNRGPSVLVAEWLTLALALIVVGLRLHGRCISLSIPGWDDYTILAATVCLTNNDMGEDSSADVENRSSELHRPSSASSKSTIGLDGM